MSQARIYALLERLQDIAAKALARMTDAELLSASLRDGYDVEAEVTALQARVAAELPAFELKLRARASLHSEPPASDGPSDWPAGQDSADRDALDSDIAGLDLAWARVQAAASEAWSPEKAAAVELEYRCYLQCLRDFPAETITPAGDCERFWRGHAGCEDLYRRQTAGLLGYALKHPDESRPAAVRPGRRRALVIATRLYDDPRLPPLSSAGADAVGLQQVLAGPLIGNYTVTVCQDETFEAWRAHIKEFFAAASAEEQLLLYISGHAVKDAHGELYFAAKDTRLEHLSATGIPASFVRQHSESSAARGVLTVLDTCFSGGFGGGALASPGSCITDKCLAHGAGRVVIAASDALHPAWAADCAGQVNSPSLFSRHVIEGLRTGEADLDGDGQISSSDLYNYVAARMSAQKVSGPRPQRWASGLDTDLIVASSLRRKTRNTARALRAPERAFRGNGPQAVAAGIAVLAVGVALVSIWHQPHLLAVLPEVDDVQTQGEKLTLSSDRSGAELTGSPRPEVSRSTAPQPPAAHEPVPLVRQPPAPRSVSQSPRPVTRESPEALGEETPAAPAVIVAQSSRVASTGVVQPGAAIRSPGKAVTAPAPVHAPPAAPSPEDTVQPAGGPVPVESAPAPTAANPPSAAPESDPPLMPLERAYMATVERIIKEHRLVPDTPEYRSALLKGQETLVSFELDRNGRVGQVFVDRPSGSIALDKLAARIVSSGFYPPFPEGAWPDQAHHLFTTEIMFR